MEERNNTGEKPIRDEHGLFLPGNPGSPGRPKGKTIKERVREWLEEHPEDMKGFVDHFVKENRELAWQMLEGKPKQDLGVEGELELIITEGNGSDTPSMGSSSEPSGN